jgi:hypothetical protein
MMISKNNNGTQIYIVECDFCKVQSKSSTKFEDPGDAAESARKHGFITKQMGLIGDPLCWCCKLCEKKLLNKKQNKLKNNLF